MRILKNILKYIFQLSIMTILLLGFVCLFLKIDDKHEHKINMTYAERQKQHEVLTKDINK